MSAEPLVAFHKRPAIKNQRATSVPKIGSKMAKMSNPPRIRQVHFNQAGKGAGQDLVRNAKTRQRQMNPRPTQTPRELLALILLAA